MFEIEFCSFILAFSSVLTFSQMSRWQVLVAPCAGGMSHSRPHSGWPMAICLWTWLSGPCGPHQVSSDGCGSLSAASKSRWASQSVPGCEWVSGCSFLVPMGLTEVFWMWVHHWAGFLVPWALSKFNKWLQVSGPSLLVPMGLTEGSQVWAGLWMQLPGHYGSQQGLPDDCRSLDTVSQFLWASLGVSECCDSPLLF